MNTLKRVRLKVAWNQWPKGHIFNSMSAMQADAMVGAGQAEYVTEETVAAGQPEYVTEAMVAPVDRMMRPGDSVRRKGRR